MISRRSVLTGLGTLAVGQLVMGCSRPEAALQIRLLKDSIPVQLLKEFQQTAKPAALDFLVDKQLAELFDWLKTWKTQGTSANQPGSPVPFFGKPSAPIADLVTLGDYWLTSAIQQNLIQPLRLEDIPEWQQLPATWKTLVRRDRQGQLSDQGAVWAAPYRWGTVMLVYRKDKFAELGWTPSDWSDLWRPALTRRISLLDSPRAVIGLTLKKLGQSVNLADLSTVPALAAELKALQQQVKLYSSDAYLQPLILEDTWLAVGWSSEILPMLKRDPHLAAVIPTSGTMLTADLWVRSAAATNVNSLSRDRLALLKQWIRFCWQPQTATQISLLTSVASPIYTGGAQLPASLQHHPLLVPPPEVWQRSEFFLPLSAAAIDQYRQLWTTTRQLG